jgi:hypothetical protein
MISIVDLIVILALGLAGYFVYQVKRAVDIFQSANFGNYKSYQESIEKGERKPWKPLRKQDEQGIHRIAGDKTKITTKTPQGIAHTTDVDIPIFDANPDDVMAAVDKELGYTEVKNNG